MTCDEETWRSSFVSGVNEVFTEERVIHEKYSVDLSVEEVDQRTGLATGRQTTVVSSGKGGEYESQIGFGWTNGVVLAFMHDLEELGRGSGDGGEHQTWFVGANVNEGEKIV